MSVSCKSTENKKLSQDDDDYYDKVSMTPTVMSRGQRLMNHVASPQPWNSRQSLTAGIATFLDGMSRALILPFGPSLVHRLLVTSAVTVTSSTATESTTNLLKLSLFDSHLVPVPYALVVTAYVVGRALGWRCFQQFSVPQGRLPRIVARLSGIILSLYVFTLGSGLKSVAWLVFIRFVAAMLVGVLCAITCDKSKPQSGEDKDETEMPFVRTARSLSDEFQKQEVGLVKRWASVDNDDNGELQVQMPNIISSLSSIKIYLFASAASILLGGLTYRHVTDDAISQALTRTNQWSLSPAFLVAIALVAEATMRFCFCYIFDDGTGAEAELSDAYQSPLSDLVVVDWTPRPTREVPISEEKSRKRLISINSQSDIFLSARERLESTSSFRLNTTRRARLETSDSDFFFDCQSVLSDMEDMPFLENNVMSNDKLRIACYQDRKVVYYDGSPALVPSGDSPEVIPKNYLTVCNGNVKKAEAMWNATQEWRREQRVWKIHRMPNKWFPQIKEAYPHFIHGVSKEGYPIIYEQPGKMNLKHLFQSGCHVGDMVRHYIFFLEYISNYICTREEVRSRKGFHPPQHSSSTWGIMVVMDVKGAGLSHLSGDVLSYLKKAGDVNNSHYPLSLKRAFAINSPFWLAGAWSGIKGIMPESVHVDLLSSHQFLRALRDRIDDDQIPAEYGGSSPYKLGEHPFENGLKELVEAAERTPEELVMDEEAYTQLPNTTPYKSTESSISISKSSSNQILRHRAGSQDSRDLRTPAVSFNLSEADNDNKKAAAVGGEKKLVLIVSVMHFIWTVVQGMMEVAVPVWILLPPDLGGLGYAPSRSGVVLFSSATALLGVVGRCFKSRLTRAPHAFPMRSFRLAIALGTFNLLVLSIGPKHVAGDRRTNSVFVMTMTIMALSCLVLCTIVGRTSSIFLHSSALIHFRANGDMVSANWPGTKNFSKDYYQGGLSTSKTTLISELAGGLMAAFILSWSLRDQRPWPLDGTVCLNLGAVLSSLLYICTFSIRIIRVNGGVCMSFSPKDNLCHCGRRSHWCLSFLHELITVSVSDMASLFDENNWSTSPLLARQGPREGIGITDASACTPTC